MNPITEDTSIRQSNAAVYGGMTTAIIGSVAVGAVCITGYNAWAGIPEAARLVLLGTCALVPVVAAAGVAIVAANNLTRGLGQRLASPQQQPQPEIAAHYREIERPAPLQQLMAPAGPQRRTTNYDSIPINYPRRKPAPLPLPTTITTNGIRVEVDKLRKMLSSPEPTRGAVQATRAGIDNNEFASYRNFLIAHHVIDDSAKPARWAADMPNEFTRDEWLDGILSTSPTTADEFD